MSAVLADDSYSSRVRWGGVFAGLAAGTISYLALVLLGTGIGFLAYEPGGEGASAKAVTIGALVWMAICTIASAYIAGLFASRAADAANKRQGRNTGAVTGMVMVLALTYLLASAAITGVASLFGAAGSVIGLGVRAGSSAAEAAAGTDAQQVMGRLGLQDEYQTMMSGLNRDQINRIVSEAVPELNPQQVNAAADSVASVLDNARRNTVQNLGNISALDDTLRAQADNIQNQLSGGAFIGSLQARGLSDPQARQVSTALSSRVDQMRQQAREAMGAVTSKLQQAADTAASTGAAASLAWIISAIVIIGLAALGGQAGASDRRVVGGRLQQQDYAEDRRRRAPE